MCSEYMDSNMLNCHIHILLYIHLIYRISSVPYCFRRINCIKLYIILYRSLM